MVLCKWMRQAMLERYRNISPDDMQSFRVTDDVEEAVQTLCSFRQREVPMWPRFRLLRPSGPS